MEITTNSTPRIVCLDVDYRDGYAMAAAIWFRGWTAGDSELEVAVPIQHVAEYVPGEFYRRELPCLLQVLAQGPQAEIIIVDGYVWLGGNRPGLGAHLYEALEHKVPVVGVAKTKFASALEAIPILHGESQSPLYVTAVGMDSSEAAQQVIAMHGPYRVPTQLKKVDQLARTAPNPIPAEILLEKMASEAIVETMAQVQQTKEGRDFGTPTQK